MDGWLMDLWMIGRLIDGQMDEWINEQMNG